MHGLPIAVSIVGDGRERERLQRRSERLGVSDLLRWHGTVPHANRLMPGLDILVLSSRTEGTPVVLFEAMHSGVPIVAANVGGVPDIATPAEALLVTPDDPEALARAVRAVYEDPLSAQRRAEAARHRLATTFDKRRWLASYEALYSQLCDSRRRGTR